MRLLDGKLGTDADVFLSNYSDFQIVGIPPPPAQPLDITRNAGSARIKGIEANVTWFPVELWNFSVNGDYTNARFVRIDVLDSSYRVGDPVDLVPRYQVSASAEREFSWGGRPGFARVDYSQIARETYRNLSIGPWFYSQSDYIHTLNFSSRIQWNDTVGFGVFAKNLLNDRGYTTPGA